MGDYLSADYKHDCYNQEANPFASYYIVLKLYLFQPPVRPAIPRDYKGV